MLSLTKDSLGDTGRWLSCHFGTCLAQQKHKTNKYLFLTSEPPFLTDSFTTQSAPGALMFLILLVLLLILPHKTDLSSYLRYHKLFIFLYIAHATCVNSNYSAYYEVRIVFLTCFLSSPISRITPLSSKETLNFRVISMVGGAQEKINYSSLSSCHDSYISQTKSKILIKWTTPTHPQHLPSSPLPL